MVGAMVGIGGWVGAAVGARVGAIGWVGATVGREVGAGAVAVGLGGAAAQALSNTIFSESTVNRRVPFMIPPFTQTPNPQLRTL